jgi:hypothetical protein
MAYDVKPGEVRVVRHGDSKDRVATILPGIGYTVDMPLLYYTGRALLQRGWAVDEVWWRPAEDAIEEWATEQSQHLVQRITEAETPLVVAKSLGTFAMPLCLGTRTAGIWLTPLLNNPRIASATADLDHRHLLVGGTADRAWVPALAEGSSATHLSIDGANHSLEHSDAEASVGVLAQVLRSISGFLDALTPVAGGNDR